MKRVICLMLSFVMLLSAAAVPVTASAAQTPYILSEKQYGKILKRVYVYSVEKKNKTLQFTKSNGKTELLTKGDSVVILGKDNPDGSLFYVRFKIKGTAYYAYVNNYYVCVEDKYNYTKKRTDRYNKFYKKNLKYKYYTYEGMPFYQFNQTGKGDSINGLKIAFSCGPHAIAAACSALYGDIITPETLMKHMSGAGVYASGNGSVLTPLERGLHSYIENAYNLKYECINIEPKETFDYLKKGYMVIYGVENLDGLKVFTGLSHYILLVGYDSVGNIITVNSNLKSNLFDAYSEERIKKNAVNSMFYRENTLAIRYRYDDEYTAFSDETKCKVVDNATVTQHFNGMGRYFKLKKGTELSVIGVKKNKLFVSIDYKGQEQLGFIDRKAVDYYISVTGNEDVYLYDGENHVPSLTLTDYKGKPVPETDYQLTIPEDSSDVGIYRINITYSGKYIGESYYEYSILPHSTSLTELKPRRHSVKLSWEPSVDEKQLTDYYVEYSTDENFEKDVTGDSVSAGKNSLTVRNLKRDTTYYFRIAASKTTDDYTVDSSWSNVQSVKTE